jgi:hypothetical protein
MTESLKTSEILFFSAFFIIGIIFMIVGLFGQYYQRKRKHKAIFTIPIRRIYFWFVCVLTVVIIIKISPFSEIDFIIRCILLAFCIGMALWFSSSDILVSDDGIYSFMKFVPWSNMTGISDHFFGFFIFTTSGIFKRVGYVKFIWRIQKHDLEQLQSLHANKLKSAEQAP